MANTIFSSNHHHQNMKALHVVGLLCLMLLVHKGESIEFTVGGSKGWHVPDPNEVHYNQWAENNRFQIGDSLGKTIEIFFQGKSYFFNAPYTTEPLINFPIVFLFFFKHHLLRTLSNLSTLL